MKFDLHDRVTAAQGLLDNWRGRPFAWGSADCLHLFVDAMARRGAPVDLGAVEYGDLKGALRAVKARGHASLEAAIDAHGLLRIPPAAMLACDLVALPSETKMCALTVALGNGRVLGFWSPADDIIPVVHVLQPKAFVTAWRT